jgi:lysophospholipase L1-like esterase
MTKPIWFFRLIGFLLLFTSCEHESPIDQRAATGSANFRVYVAIGNSITAGFQSSALYSSAQEYSFPNLLARQMRTTGGALEFTQPAIKEPGVGGRQRITSLSPLSVATDASLDARSASIFVNADLPEFCYHNVGIPGAYVFNPYTLTNDILDTLNSFEKSFSGLYGDNPFHHVVRRNPANSVTGNSGSVFQQVKKKNPTFMTVWLGNNDVFVFAASGGVAPYTAVSTFQTHFNAMIDSLLTLNASISIATIPDVTQTAFMTTIPWFVPDPNDLSKPLFDAYLPLSGETSTGTRKNLGPNDRVLLTAAVWLANGYGLPSFIPGSRNQPLPHTVILDSAEVALCRSLIEQYNTIIRQRENDRVAIVDAHATFDTIAKHGIVVAGVRFTTAYLSGGIFSLDGIHPTSQGAAIIANKFIEAINNKWRARIPYVDVLSLPGIPIPLQKKNGSLTLHNLVSIAKRNPSQWWF